MSGFALGQRRCGGCLGGVAECGFACWSVLGVGCSGVVGCPLFGAGLFVLAGGAWLVAWSSVGCVCARCAAHLVRALQEVQSVMGVLVMPMVRVPLVMQRVMVTLVMPMARVL